MTQLFRVGEELSYHELISLELDGLLTPLTRECWIASGEPITPLVRSCALAPPPMTHVAYSHETAYWIWWGEGLAPATTSVSAVRRKRVRTAYEGFRIHDNVVPEGHTVALGSMHVTSEAATLYALLFELCESRTPSEQNIRRARKILFTVPAEARVAFAQFMSGLYRRPRLRRVRQLATTADPLVGHNVND